MPAYFLFLLLREAISFPFTFVTFVPVTVCSLSRCINTKFLYGISYTTSRYDRCRFSMNDAICPNRVSFPTTSVSLPAGLRSSPS